MPPKQKTEDTSDSSLVFQHLLKVNRPLNANDVANSLQGSVSKTNVLKVLTSLAASGKIVGKTYGKQVIYCANQDNVEIPSLDDAEAETARIDQLTELIASTKTQNSILVSKNNSLKAQKTIPQISSRIDFLKSENHNSSQRILKLQSGDVISQDEKVSIESEYKNNVKLWSQRRRLFKDIFDSITENYPGKPKDLLAQLGIETDEDVGINIKEF
ncbi:Homologous-pairing protein 2-like protein [Smittium culicis]|uniref:Homologous-pairing protein 2 homolog n=1 Tax=Smittium culicis TaxID=133412 RepID=A0A1R1XIV8_9FUNG|nr:Homologous-pairing protein 2-like protein [Smittium culicis]